MRRRAASQTDSFDMLLDAVTNAFGGILFLAILIVILVGRRGAEQAAATTEAPEPQQVAALQREVADLERRLEGLDLALEEQLASQRMLAPGDLAQLVAEVMQMHRQLEELLARQTVAASHLETIGEAVSDAERRRQELTQRLQEAQREKATLEKKLAELNRSLVQSAPTPRLRATDKREFPLVVRFGRVYIPFRPWSDRTGRRLNVDHFLILGEDSDLLRATPKPYAGHVLDDQLDFAAGLRTDLADLDVSEFYVAVAVWEDSFAEFAALRSALVAWGMEYRLVPVAEGGGIEETSQERSYVQ